jgi:hypothetical protein
MGFIHNLFTSGSSGAHDDGAPPQSPRVAQNPWRGVFNPGSPSPRFRKGNAQWHDKPAEADAGHKASTVMDEIVRAPSVGQAKVTGTGPSVAEAAAAAGTASPRAHTQHASGKEAPHEFGMDKFGYGA